VQQNLTLDDAPGLLMGATFAALEKPSLENRIRCLVSSAIEHADIAADELDNAICTARKCEESELQKARSCCRSVGEKLEQVLDLVTQLRHQHLCN